MKTWAETAAAVVICATGAAQRLAAHAALVLAVALVAVPDAAIAVATLTPPAQAESQDRTIKLSGFIRSRSTFAAVPQGNFWQFKITKLAPDGAHVEAGDVVAQFYPEDLDERERAETTDYLQAKVSRTADLSRVESEIDELVESVAERKRQLEILNLTIGPEAADTSNDSWLTSARERLTQKLDRDAKELSLRLETEKLARRREVTTTGTIKTISRMVMKGSDWERGLAEDHPLAEMRVFRVEIELGSLPQEAKPNGEVEILVGT